MSDLKNIQPAQSVRRAGSRPEPATPRRAGSRLAAPRERTARALAGLAVLALGGLLLASCGGSGEPEEYNATVKENYVKGCEISIDESNSQIRDAVAVCECAYEKIERGVEFEDFKNLDDDLREDIERGVEFEDFKDLDDDLREDIERGVEFEDFKDLDDDLREDIEALNNIDSSDSTIGQIRGTIGQIRGYIRDCITSNSTTS